MELPFVASGLHGKPGKARFIEGVNAKAVSFTCDPKGVSTAASLGREQFLIIREESNFAKWG